MRSLHNHPTSADVYEVVRERHPNISRATVYRNLGVLASRGDVLWNIDKNTKVRFSHENKDVQALYKEYLRQPLGHKAHMLLHTDHFGWKMPSGH